MMKRHLHKTLLLGMALLMSVPAMGVDIRGAFPGRKVLGETSVGHAAAPARESSPVMRIKGGPEFWGVVEYAKSWENLPDDAVPPAGVYSFKASDPNDQKLLYEMGWDTPNGGGVYDGEMFKYVNFSIMYDAVVSPYYYKVNTSTWERDGYGAYFNDSGCIGMDLTKDPITGNIYGYFYNPLNNDESNRFGVISFSYDYWSGVEVPSVYEICRETENIICLAASPEGQLYGVADDGAFYMIDKYSGEKTLVDYTGVMPTTFRQSMTFDPNTGRLYWACFRIDYTSALYEINIETGTASLISEIADDKEISCLHIPLAEASDDAPSSPALTLSFPKGATQGTITLALPDETFGGDSLTGILEFEIMEDGNVILSGSGEAGTTVTKTYSASEGAHEYYAVCSNSVGQSPKSEPARLFVGFDYPKMEDGCVKADYNAATKTMTVTWTAPTQGESGGYIDEPNLQYSVIRYPDGMTVADHTWTTEFSETLEPGNMASYYYTVVAHNHDKSSMETMSNRVTVGDSMPLPFIDDFSTDDLYGLYTVTNDGQEDIHWNESMNSFAIFFGWSYPLDSWLLTPPVRLEPGKTYTFMFDIKSSSSYDTEKFEVGFGQGIETSGYEHLTDGPVILKSTDPIRYSYDVSVAEAGLYRFGIHACSDSFQSGMVVNYIAIETGMIPESPAAVLELTVMPADKGALEAEISFTAPTLTRENQELGALTKIEVARDGNVVKTFEAPATGSSLNFTDSGMTDGWHEYTVTPYNSYGKGETKTSKVFIGMDIPCAPETVTLRETQEGVTLTWDAAAATGKNGEFVDPEEVKYNIYDPEGNLVTTVAGTEYTEVADTESTTGLIYYSVAASLRSGESEAASSNYLVTGPALNLPYAESFPYGVARSGLWWTFSNNDINAFDFAVDLSSDNDWGSIKWYAINNGEYAYLNTGKFKLGEENSPMLFFDYRLTPGTPLKLDVIVDPDQTGDRIIATIDASTMTGETEWRKASVELPEYLADANYFVVRFRAEGDRHMNENYEANTLYLDNIRMRDVPEKDVAVRVEAPTEAYPGETVVPIVYVTNNGLAADKISISLTIDGKEADSATLSLDLDETASLTMEYDVPSEASGDFMLQVYASLKGDSNDEDNYSEEIAVRLNDPTVARVEDLKAEVTNAVVLTWSAPTAPNRKLDTFNSYTPWSRSETIGEWKLFDGDDVETNAYTGMDYPGIGEKLSWMVFNKKYATLDVSQKDIFTPLSGDQCLIAVANLHEYGKGILCDDWLISPELSGESQTIEFDIKSFTDYEEDFAIYVSSGSDDVEELKQTRLAFEKFGAGNQWRHYSYELPEGTKFFAIVYSSNLSGVMLDNVAFELPTLSIIGYDIYRDDEKIATVYSSQTSYVDPTPSEGGNEYSVVVKYDGCDSAMSEKVSTVNSAVETINAEDLFARDRNARIYTINGIYRGQGFETYLNLETGLYVISGKKIYKK